MLKRIFKKKGNPNENSKNSEKDKKTEQYNQMKNIENYVVSKGNDDQKGFADVVDNMGKPGGMSYAEMRSKYG